MTLEQLRSELEERGFQYESSARLNRLIQDAYLLDIAEVEDWPWLQDSAKGAMPLSIEDLRTVEYVLDLTNEEDLEPLREGYIVDDWNPNLAETGTAQAYYLREGTTVHTYPVASSDEFEVRYWKVPPELEAATEPLMPKRWHSLILDAAVVRAYPGADDYELAQAAEVKFQAGLQQMRESLLNQQRDEADEYVIVTDPAGYH